MKYEDIKIGEYYLVEYAAKFVRVKVLRKVMNKGFLSLFPSPHITVIRCWDGYVGQFEIERFYPESAADITKD